jgi:hypothetical protein
VSSIRARALAKAEDVSEQIQALEGGERAAVGVGGTVDQVGDLAFQRWRFDWLMEAAGKTEDELLDIALSALQRFALHRRFRDRVELDLCRVVLGCESLEELLARLEVPSAS